MSPDASGTGRTSLRIGLVGPIGCGKSTVAGWLADKGAVVVDADRVAGAVLDPGEPALDEVIAVFGDDLLRDDGSIDRSALGEVVFSDPAALARLEAIVHPVVRPRILAAIADAEAAGAEVVVLEAIRLIDGGYGSLMDETWLVTCRPGIQRARLADRGVVAEDADRRIDAQRELIERATSAATRVIETSGTRTGVRAGVLAALAAAREMRATGR